MGIQKGCPLRIGTRCRQGAEATGGAPNLRFRQRCGRPRSHRGALRGHDSPCGRLDLARCGTATHEGLEQVEFGLGGGKGGVACGRRRDGGTAPGRSAQETAPVGFRPEYGQETGRSQRDDKPERAEPRQVNGPPTGPPGAFGGRQAQVGAELFLEAQDKGGPGSTGRLLGGLNQGDGRPHKFMATGGEIGRQALGINSLPKGVYQAVGFCRRLEFVRLQRGSRARWPPYGELYAARPWRSPQ